MIIPNVGVPTYMARAYTESGELVRLFADWNIGTMPLYVLSPPQRHPVVRVRAFVEWVVALLKDGTVTDALVAS